MMKKYLLRACLVAVLSLGIAAAYDTQPASAASGPCFFTTTNGAITGTGGCSVSGAGDYGTNDVLTGRSTSGAGEAIPGNVNTKNEFINFVKKRFNNGGPHDKVGSAFIMQTMRGDHKWPTAGDIANWEDRMNQSDVTVQRYAVDIHRTSWYDTGKNNTFFDSYSPGARMAIVVKYKGNVHAVIETGCGNLANTSIPLPEEQKWGAMTATSQANRTTVKKGQNITWTHVVWDTGSVGNDKTETINGDVFWSAQSTGPIPNPDKGPNGQVTPDRSYSRAFEKGKTKGATKTFTFTVPNNAKKNDKYCQYITYKPTSSKDNSAGKSTAACVKVTDVPTPVGGDDTATCSVGLNIHGPIEVSTSPFAANYNASVTTSRPTKDDRNNAEAWGAWSGWSGWSGSDTNQSRSRKRTATADRVYYRVVKAYFTSSFDGNNTADGRTSPQTSGNLSPYSTSYGFPYNPEQDGNTYTVGGEFTFKVEKVVEHYKITQTQTQDRSRTKTVKTVKKKKVTTYGPWVTGGTSTSKSGWSKNGADTVTNVGGDTVDCGEDTIVYAYRPYMDVYGGDIMAGAYQANMNTAGCSQVATAGITGWNHNRNETYNGAVRNDYAGAGAEAGAFALANINSFSSALKTPSGVNGPASGLSFANTTGVAGTNYGGNAGGIPLSCNFAADKDSAQPISSNYGGDTSYGGQNTYLSTGSVYISGDVVYANSGGWSDTQDIPRFKLLVNGDIYIDSDVTELDGLYVATGNIYTCATGFGAPSSDYDTCDSPLKVYGAFAAKKINFLRTHGTLRDASTGDDYNSDNIGETFIYTPELWLPNEPNGGTPKYDSILGLPPVL